MRHRRRSNLSTLLLKPLMVIMVICGLFGIVWLRSSLTSVEYAISDLENKKTQKIIEAKLLMAEKAAILSMNKIEKSAVRNIGLTFPDRKKVTYVRHKDYGPQSASLKTQPAPDNGFSGGSRGR